MGTVIDAREMRIDVTHALARAAVFRELAVALDDPSPERRAEIAARWRARLGRSEIPECVRPSLSRTLVWLHEVGVDLQAEHVRLFGPAGRAPLTETSWGDAGRLLGKATALADVAGFYRAFGLAPTTAHPRPEDHLAVELEFMSVLALKEAWARGARDADALAVTRDATAKFLGDHLGTWLDAWCAALATETAAPFYVGLADVIRTLVRAECARLGVAPRLVAGRPLDRDVGGDAVVCPRAEAPSGAACD